MGMLSSVGDFFGNMKRRGAEIAQAGADKAKTAYDGLRGQAQPSSAGADEAFVRSAQNRTAVGMVEGQGTPGPRAAAGTDFVVDSQGTAQRPGTSGGLRSSEASVAARAADPRGYTGPSRGQMLQTAANYTPRGLAGYAAKAGRLVGPAAAIPEVYNAGENIVAGENPLKSIGRASLRTGGAMLGGAIGAAGGTLAAPGVGTLAGGVAGGVAGYSLADKASTALFGEDPSSVVKPAAAATAPANTAVPNGQPAFSGGGSLAEQPVTAAGGQDGLVDLTDGNRARPGVLTDSNVGVPVPGQGAFKVGNNPAQAINTGSPAAAQPQAAPTLRSAAQPGRDFNTDVKTLGLRGASHLREQDIQNENNKATLAATIAQRNLDLEKWKYDKEHTERNEQEKRVGERTADYARAKLTPPGGLQAMVPGQKDAFENGVKQKTAEVNSLIKSTQSRTGKTMGQLSDAQHTLLLKGNDLRERLDDYRKSAPSFVQDFIGNKRFDSDNLYSYLPARDSAGKVKPAIPETFGYSVEMGNGNKVKVYSLTTADGSTGFNFTGPNKPVDADAMELMKPAIDAARKK